MKKGLFITLEGIEASGKSTSLDTIKKLLLDEKNKFSFTREPGGNNIKINEDIRNIILDPKNKNMSYKTEALLYAASRSQHVKEFIQPNIDKGINVICDRYMDSSLVYQGVCRNLGEEWIKIINEPLVPDMTFFFNLTPSEMIERLKKRKEKSSDRLDQENFEFHKKAYNAYLKLINNEKDRFYIIDPNLKTEEIAKKIISTIKNKEKEIINN